MQDENSSDNICEDDISMTYAEYSDNYLVAGGKSVNIFFYCEEQLVFKLVTKNFKVIQFYFN